MGKYKNKHFFAVKLVLHIYVYCKFTDTYVYFLHLFFCHHDSHIKYGGICVVVIRILFVSLLLYGSGSCIVVLRILFVYCV